MGVELGYFVAVFHGDCDGFWIGLNAGESVGNAVGSDSTKERLTVQCLG